ncbi:MAG TPA: putative sulfate exporter family transporter [Anaeromyxobacteraceae bacterium]|nr:putative sulfate exporter family transporter [Anaeromyxobacteraceae bacterium]
MSPAPGDAAPQVAAAHPSPRVASALVVLGAAAACVPGFPAAAALAAGVFVAVAFGNPLAARTRVLARRLLPASVVGLGGAMDLGAVARTGAHGIGYTVTTIVACAALGVLLSRALSVERRTGILVTVGTAICGGSAIAAAAPVLGADDRETSVSLATVFVLNSVALLVFPLLGHAARLDEPAFGLWAALAIHDTSSVVGAALQYGPVALGVATTVKLARALWIVPVTLAIGLLERRHRGGGGRVSGRPPWFILGFVAVAALATYVPELRPAGHALAAVARRALVVTLFLIGLGLSRGSLRAVGARPFALGALLWVAMGAGTLAAVRLGLFAA